MSGIYKYMAVHEAGHAIVALSLGGFAEEIGLGMRGARRNFCRVSWPDDGVDRTVEKLLVLAAGAAATAIYTRRGMDWAILQTGIGDWRRMKETGSTDDRWFTEARNLCRSHWTPITAVAEAAMATGSLSETEIIRAAGTRKAQP